MQISTLTITSERIFAMASVSLSNIYGLSALRWADKRLMVYVTPATPVTVVFDGGTVTISGDDAAAAEQVETVLGAVLLAFKRPEVRLTA